MKTPPVALITGASQGIGRAIAMKFAEAGYAMALAARRQDVLQNVAAQVGKSYNVPVLVAPTDLRKPEQIAGLVSRTIENFGKIDVLANNAGVLYVKPFLEISAEEYREMMDVNLDAVFRLTQLALPHMIEQKSGAIVNIASLAGKNAVRGGTAYAASKWAIRGFAASLMLEVRHHGIRVITVFPGSVDTPMLDNSPTPPRRETMLQPEDVAHAVYAAVSVPERAMISEIDIRPSNPQKP